MWTNAKAKVVNLAQLEAKPQSTVQFEHLWTEWIECVIVILMWIGNVMTLEKFVNVYNTKEHTWPRSRSNACVLRSRSRSERERERNRRDFEMNANAVNANAWIS